MSAELALIARARIRLARVFALLLLPIAAIAGSSFPQPPLPENIEIDPVAKRIVYNGLEMRASVFRSPQPAAEIIAFYEKAWKGRVVIDALGDTTVVGHGDGDYFTSVRVAADGAGSKGEIGIVNVGSAPKHFEPGKGLPKPMGSKVFNDIAYPDDPVPARTVALRNGLSAKQNAAFFRERLAGEGWKPVADNACAQRGCVLGFERGSANLSLVVIADTGGQSQVVITVQQP
jgi:hypothetical protein